MKLNHRNVMLALTLACFGCEEEKKAPEAAPAATPAPIVEPAPAPAAPEKSAADAAAEEAAAAEKAAAAKQEAAAAEDPLTLCCRSLGQKGFMERSPEYMGASQACGEALQAKKDLASVLPAIKKALKGKALPDTCGK